ncbi:GTP-binding protein [Zhihengliuella sp.]|uniref:sulfate adenylyltransferase subunit 1 n=1 Tax=Zhihengliuella sp. TaxID=1954483 RepID=UPI002812514B|nr:GTP-binding protein [Zhihengliuella sp.]
MSDTLFRLATAGSVDDGKSTLVGRLLHDAKAILADSLDDIRRVSAERGFGGDTPALDLALVTDGLRAEREQGITIDVAYRYFSTPRRSFILADCPGHVQYTRNTVTGASTAHAALVLVDARNGVVEQTRRHLGVLGLLGVPQVVVVVNKMDLIDWDESAFAAIRDDVVAVADRLGVAGVRVVPVSALQGDFVVDRGDSAPWYTGPTVLDLLETLPARPAAGEASPARLDVQLVLRPQGALAPEFAADADALRDFRGYAGTVSDGPLAVGDRVAVYNDGQRHRARVTGLRTPAGEAERAEAGQAVVVTLDADLDIARGAALVAEQLEEGQPHDAVTAVREFGAAVCVLADARLTPGQRVLVKHGTQVVAARVDAVDNVLRLSDLSREPAASLGLNDLGLIRLRTAKPLAATAYSRSRAGGSFLVIDPAEGNTLAAGMIEPAPLAGDAPESGAATEHAAGPAAHELAGAVRT